MQYNHRRALSQKLLFIKDVEMIVGRNRLTLRRWWTAGKFPKPIKLNGTSLAWHIDILNRWIEETMSNYAD
jgi:prophage regulatory protein